MKMNVEETDVKTQQLSDQNTEPRREHEIPPKTSSCRRGPTFASRSEKAERTTRPPEGLRNQSRPRLHPCVC